MVLKQQSLSLWRSLSEWQDNGCVKAARQGAHGQVLVFFQVYELNIPDPMKYDGNLAMLLKDIGFKPSVLIGTAASPPCHCRHLHRNHRISLWNWRVFTWIFSKTSLRMACEPSKAVSPIPPSSVDSSTCGTLAMRRGTQSAGNGAVNGSHLERWPVFRSGPLTGHISDLGGLGMSCLNDVNLCTTGGYPPTPAIPFPPTPLDDMVPVPDSVGSQWAASVAFGCEVYPDVDKVPESPKATFPSVEKLGASAICGFFWGFEICQVRLSWELLVIGARVSIAATQ